MKKTKLFMDTVVDIQVIDHEASKDKVETKIESAFEAFRKVEQACSRFSPDSELMIACRTIEKPVPISPFLFEPLKFALEVAKFTDGVYDPAIGKVMEKQGFNRHYLTGALIESSVDESATFRDIVLDETEHTLFLNKSLVIDLGAIAKGFAIDLACMELKDFAGYVVNAGGDLFAGGVDENGQPWKIGIQHPEDKDKVIHVVELSNKAICTSGSYERKNKKVPGMHHIIHPKTGISPNDWVSCSVIAPYAMMADAFSTIALLLGREKGKQLIQDVDLDALFITPKLKIETVGGNRNGIEKMV